MISTKTINHICKQNKTKTWLPFGIARDDMDRLETEGVGRAKSGGDIAEITETFNDQAEGIGAVGDDIAKLVLSHVQNVGTESLQNLGAVQALGPTPELVKVREPAAAAAASIAMGIGIMITAALHLHEACDVVWV